MILTDNIFNQLIIAASLAPSADNMQPWEFQKNNDTIEVFYAKQRSLPTDTLDMFGYIGIGSAIQNIVVKANQLGLSTKISYNTNDLSKECIATLSFENCEISNELADFITERNTNRCPYKTTPLTYNEIKKLTSSVNDFETGIHWTTNTDDYKKIANLDANSSYIRLEFKPFHDELFNILRFTKKDNEKFRYGLTFDSLEVPAFAVKFAQLLKYNSINKIVAKLGFGKMVAKQLSDKLTKTGALCLLTVKNNDIISYLEAGLALEQLWLTATQMKLSVHPYGVLPQYFTKTVIEPEFFLPKYLKILDGHKKVFYSVFKKSLNEAPAVLLRIGYSNKQSGRISIRLNSEQFSKI